jgi:DNA-directed RNA polymerase specialized sigma24 family protein
MAASSEERFRSFLEIAEPRLHRAFVAKLGWERGREATAEALGYAWEHWAKIERLENPMGYLYRVGQSRVRVRKQRIVFASPDLGETWYEPSLARALAQLPERQRVAVVLIHGYSWTSREVGDLFGVRATTVQSHVARGLVKLRQQMKVGIHARSEQ